MALDSGGSAHFRRKHLLMFEAWGLEEAVGGQWTPRLDALQLNKGPAQAGTIVL